MTVYYILLIGAFVIGVPLCKDWGLPEKKAKFLRVSYCFIIGFAFFILSAIRKSTGYDYNLYGTWFNQLYFMSYEQIIIWSREKGFTVPVKILQVISENYQIMFIVISFVIAAGIMIFIYKYSALPHVSVAAFLAFGFYFISMNFMRQMIAAVIVAYAMKYIHSNQPMRYLAYILLASCFHFSALIMIPFYIILKIKMNWIVLGIYSAVSAVLFVNSEKLMLIVTDYFYSSYDPLYSMHMTLGLSPVYTVVFALFFLTAFLLRKPLIKLNNYNGILINSLFFTAFFELIGIKHSVISRFILFFAIAPIIMIVPDLVKVIAEMLKKAFGKNKTVKLIITYSVCLAFIVFGILLYNFNFETDYNGVVPYKTVWETQNDAS